MKQVNERSLYRVIAAPKKPEGKSRAFVIKFPGTRGSAIELARAILFSYNIRWADTRSVLQVWDEKTSRWVRIKDDHGIRAEYDLTAVSVSEVESELLGVGVGGETDDPWVPLEQRPPNACGAAGFESTFEE